MESNLFRPADAPLAYWVFLVLVSFFWIEMEYANKKRRWHKRSCSFIVRSYEQ